MGQRGRPRKPTELKILEGTYQASRDAGSLLLPTSRPKCPPHIKGEARKEWYRIVHDLEATGMLASVDRAALAGYCDAYARWVTLCEDIDARGMTRIDENGTERRRPQMMMRTAVLAEMRAFLTEFGMTPASRSRIKTQGTPKLAGQQPRETRFGRQRTA